MTEGDRLLERESGLKPREYVKLDETTATYDNKYLTCTTNLCKERLNFETGISKYCLESLVQNEQLQQARENVKNNMDEDTMLEQYLEASI